MSALSNLLAAFRSAAVSEREKGTYFEELIVAYLRNEATYRDLYSDVWLYADWAKLQGVDGRDVGIDLVAKTADTNEFHAIQCKFYAEEYRVTKGDLDSFFTASGKKPFALRVIVTTTSNWNEHANDALQDQQPPCIKIDLAALESSQIDWAVYQPKATVHLKTKKELRDHQVRALNAVEHGLATAERGKMIMACGTGKTLTSLKIAQQLAGRGKRVLFLVPSLALLSQTLTEWTQESDIPLHSFAVCSDTDVGKKRKKDDDVVQTYAHELRYPATTEPDRLAKAVSARHDADHMSVVFSTYHSIDVIHQAQHAHGLSPFDLIVCDEAHRTTGQTFDDEDESAFVRVHDSAYVRGARRLYMTATPRIYGEAARATADQNNVVLCSMDDPALFGKELFVITFNEAVKAGLLVDYKVIVLAMDEKHVSSRIQKLLSDGDNQVKVEDAAKIIGCWKALSKQDTHDDLADDEAPMKRAVAFCQVIEYQGIGGKTHKISSKKIADMFEAVVEEYKANSDETDGAAATLGCEARHVDGSMSASEKEERLSWLKADVPDNTCRILSNVRCLSEGVDVPSLDAVLFLTPRNSQVDVVQSVGRVMRLAPGKRRGYIVLPVVIPAGVEPDAALNDNKTYKVVWQVLQALRSHDDRFDAMINKLDLNGADIQRMEVIAVTDKIARKAGKNAEAAKAAGRGTKHIGTLGRSKRQGGEDKQMGLAFEIGEIERAIYAKVVQKCGNRSHWEDWAVDIAKIAKTHIVRIETILENPANARERTAFDGFASKLRDDLNDSISDHDIVEMLAQHLITKPVFDSLFSDYSFASHNPMSKAMQGVLDVLQEHSLHKEADTLQKFYDSVKLRAEGINDAQGKQRVVVELYDKFFSKAFPRLRDKLGIVYTPVEVVDFIIHSVNDVLKAEFGQTLGSDAVQILDPFTGTGTFITRLLQSGLMTPEQIRTKYQGQIHANELVLLAYYIAAINIESVYHGLVGGDYAPFDGICLTDTFQMYEKDDLVSAQMEQNGERRKRQRKLDIRVIIGNPPYSVGQGDANANNQNVVYKHLDDRIRSTYAQRSKATNKNALYDSYIRAIRWASDRIGDSGVIGFVTNAGFIEASTADGLRKCLVEEFSNIYVFHLRGNQRTSGEQSRKEGGKIFGSGSRAPIAISILVKNPNAIQGQIYFHDIGNYLSQEEKLEKISDYASIQGISANGGWQRVEPDEHGDWLRQRNGGFTDFIVLGDKDGREKVKLFYNYSSGVKTQRDAWCFNASKGAVAANMKRMIGFYNAEVARFDAACVGLDKKGRDARIDDFINSDPTKISWTRALKQDLAKGREFIFDAKCLTRSLYRPFTKQWLYFNRRFNEMVYQMPRIFPDAAAENRMIVIKQRWGGAGQFALMTDHVVELQTDGGTQCFPLYLYDDVVDSAAAVDLQGGLFSSLPSPERTRRDALTDEGLTHFRSAYPSEQIGKHDIFYFVYGLMHSPEYRDTYADNLAKELPRIPLLKRPADFWAYSKAGRDLAELHLNYESVEPYPAKVIGPNQPEDYRVTKMKYGREGKEKDLTTLHYNSKITVTGIPLEAYEYVVNGKPALDWVVERQCVKADGDSGIVNDANDWADDTLNDPKYPLELFLRIVTVSLATMKIVRGLPDLVLADGNAQVALEVSQVAA